MTTVQVNSDFNMYQQGGLWSDNIAFMGWKDGQSTQKICGHKTPKPRDGDVLMSHMKSGRTALFVMHDFEYPGDPPDMFFAKASFIGYVDDNELPNKKLNDD